MTIRYKCVGCDASMKIKDEKAGTTATCPKCKAEFTVPPPEPDEGDNTATAVADAGPKTEEELEDEYQKILMGEDSSGAAKPKKRPVDSDAFLAAESSDEHPVAAPEPAAERRSGTDHKAGAGSGVRSAAEISAAMMKGKSDPAIKNKKTGRAFGEGENDRDKGRAKLNAETRMYYIKHIGLGGTAIVIVASGLFWLSSMMMGGVKVPPLGRVSGVIKLDGKPLKAATITFQPMFEAGKVDNKIGGSAGTTDAEGKFELYYLQGIPGAWVGKHYVQVRAQSDIGLELVPPKYNSSSETYAEVKAGSNPYNLDLTSK